MNPFMRPTRFFAIFVLFNLLLFTALRIAFYTAFVVPSDPLPWSLLGRSFYVGMKFDLRLAVLMNLPMLAISWIGPLNPYKKTWARRCWIGWTLVVNLVVVFLYIADFGYFGYLRTRLDIMAVKLLENPMISLGMVWESYPVVWIFIGLVGLAVLIGLGTGWLLRRLSRAAPAGGPLYWRIAGVVLTSLLCAGAIFGKLSYYPLRWSDAFFDPHPFSSALALNPVLYFLETIKVEQTPYDLQQVRDNYPLMTRFLGVDVQQEAELNYVRHVAAKTDRKADVNVVLVVLESFAAYKTGLYGNPLKGSPNFDSLARDGLHFKRFYVPAQSTARSIFALVTGIPDIELRGTSTRNPLVVHQRTIIQAFEGYEKYYFLGGSLNWANIRGLLLQSIPGLKIHEEGSYTGSRVDVWGISDLELFEEANRVFSKEKEPFFAIIQTAGDHRPYTIPADNRGFQLREVSDKEVIPYGFDSAAEFNSFRFMDHGIGNFLRVARKEKYFSNTVFIFLGDHGLLRRSDHMPKAVEQLGLGSFQVPLVFYGPGIIEGGRALDTLASEVDVLPTTASLLSKPYVNTTFGRDLLDPRFESSRYSFTAVLDGARPTIGLIGPDYYFRMSTDGAGQELNDLRSSNPRENVIERHPDIAKEMERLLRAIYETARYVRYHNGPNQTKRVVDERR